ncbi:hypothetical protein RND81_08G097000 [Saponaria officinalis]|uniref:CSC1-like protein HYP1 n=1 Tax=Saponaria officinalis TaxID=3572 RepID=A0AAW1J5I6_SAPOF
MILSALLTSVGINLGICFLFFTLYSILRKQPINARLYAPRLVAERKLKDTGFNLERLLPSAGWVKRAWELSEDDLLESSGLDGVVFMRIITFSLKVFSIAALIGMAILLPVNFTGSQLKIDISDLPNKSLDAFSISNVNNGSNRLWIHFCAIYTFTAAVCCLLYYEYKYLSLKRIDYFYASQPQPRQFTVLVRSIPTVSGQRLDESVEHFFREYHPSTYISHTIVRRTNKLQQLTEVPAAFVYFKSRFGAAIALHMQQGINPTKWITEEAPEPDDVYWPFFSTSYLGRWICKLGMLVGTFLLTVLFFLPVLVVQSLTHLEQLERYFPFLKNILRLTVVSQVITGYLPSLILQLFLSFIPPIMKTMSSIQGYISTSEIQKSACSKMIRFTTWNVFFANVLSGSALYGFDLILEPKKVPLLLAQGVPAQATFFISYVVTSGWTSLSSELFQLMALVFSYIKRIFSGKESDDLVVPSIPYEKEIPKILSLGLLGITYFFLAPLILPFILVYFCMGYLIFRNQLLNVYAPKFEMSGKYWPIVHNSTIFSLVLMHIIAMGIFVLKELPLASTLSAPLPVLTLLFNEYCRQRFLPIFTTFATECLVAKDKKEQDNPRMAEFLDKLVDAYKDPALKPKVNDNNNDDNRLTSPLLRSGEIRV